MAVKFHRQKPTPQTPQQKELLAVLRQTKCELDNARHFFDRECSEELVSATVYEINALQEKYSYLIVQAKKNDVVAR